jgi:hypothetical protein
VILQERDNATMRNGVLCAVHAELLKAARVIRQSMSEPLEVFKRCKSIFDFHTAFSLPYVYGYVTGLCRQKAGVIQNLENVQTRCTGHREARHRKYKRVNLVGGQACILSSD